MFPHIILMDSNIIVEQNNMINYFNFSSLFNNKINKMLFLI